MGEDGGMGRVGGRLRLSLQGVNAQDIALVWRALMMCVIAVICWQWMSWKVASLGGLYGFAIARGRVAHHPVKARIEPGRRVESSRVGDINHLHVGRGQQLLGARNPALGDVFQQGHAGQFPEMAHHMCAADAEFAGNLRDAQGGLVAIRDDLQDAFEESDAAAEERGVVESQSPGRAFQICCNPKWA